MYRGRVCRGVGTKERKDEESGSQTTAWLDIHRSAPLSLADCVISAFLILYSEVFGKVPSVHVRRQIGVSHRRLRAAIRCSRRYVVRHGLSNRSVPVLCAEVLSCMGMGVSRLLHTTGSSFLLPEAPCSWRVGVISAPLCTAHCNTPINPELSIIWFLFQNMCSRESHIP